MKDTNAINKTHTSITTTILGYHLLSGIETAKYEIIKSINNNINSFIYLFTDISIESIHDINDVG